MADRDLRRLSRRELIEIIYALKEKEEALTKENEDLRSALSDRKITISKAGSIAEAALALNDIFAQAQAAADVYLSSVRAAAQEGGLEPGPEVPEPAPVTYNVPEPEPTPETYSTLEPVPAEESQSIPDYGLDPSLLPDGDLWDYDLLAQEPQEPLLPDDWALPPMEDTWVSEPTEEEKRRQRFTTRLSGLIQHPTGRKPG